MRDRRAVPVLILLIAAIACSGQTPKAVPWESEQRSGPNRLAVLYGLDACQDLDHVEVAYQRSAVVVTLFAVPNHHPCTGLHFAASVAVPLHEPLGSRIVRDGARAT